MKQKPVFIRDNKGKRIEVTDIMSAFTHIIEYLSFLDTERNLPIDYRRERKYFSFLLSQLLAIRLKHNQRTIK